MSNPDPYAGLTGEELEFAKIIAGDDAPPTGDIAAVPPTPGPDAAPVPPADATAADGAAQGIDTTTDGSQPAPQDDLLAALPEDLRNRWIELESANRDLSARIEAAQRSEAQLRNDHAAMAGRLAPLQRKLAELEKQQPAPQPAPTAVDTTAADGAGLFDSPEWAEFESLFPTEAAAQKRAILATLEVTERKLRQVTESVDRRFASIAPAVERAAATAEEIDQQKRVAALAREHPDYQQVSSTSEFWGWVRNQWMPSLPGPMRRHLADKQNFDELMSDPAEVSTLLSSYKATRQPAPTPTPPAAAPAARPSVDPRLALSASPSLPSSATRPINPAALSPDEQFSYGFNSADN